jgi:uncharacterized membrane protein
MPNIHPLLIHFPIALIIVVVAIDLVGLIAKRENLLRMGSILTVVALAGGAVSVLSGVIAEESVWHTEAAEELIERHELLGFIYLGLLALLTIIRLAGQKRLLGPAGWASLFVGIVAAAIVSYSAYLGGEMVYSHGTGVAPAQTLSEKLINDEKQPSYDEEDQEKEAEGSEESE